jgi:hypothetical protein
MKKCLFVTLRSFVVTAALLITAWPAVAAESEITIQNTAVQRMLIEQLFVDRGRYFLMRHSPCQFAYLKSPAVAIARGRVMIKTRLTGQLGMAVSDGCAGTRDAFDVAISGRPFFSGEKLGLTDIRIDNISNEMYRILLQQFLDFTLREALEINLREGLQQAITDQKASYEVTVNRLSVTNLTAENGQLRASLTFALSAR